MRTALPVVAMVVLGGCCAVALSNMKTRHIVTLAIYPDNSCAFLAAADAEAPRVPIHLKPSDAFLNTACSYFLARFRSDLSAEKPLSTRIVGWYPNNPDIPRYIPDIQM